MKELGITKGEEQKAKDFFNKAYSLCGWHISYPTHGWIAKLMVHFSREQNSELLERYNEAIEVLELSLKVLREFAEEQEYSEGEVDDDVVDLIKKQEQTISKAKGE